ncbi:MAG: hypothetical protein AAGF11_44925 [Myxococcota bacterium]
MTWRRVLPAATVLILAIGCGDDGSPADPMTGTNGPTETSMGDSTAADSDPTADPTADPSTDPGPTTGDPGTSGDPTGVDESGSSSTGPGVVPCEYPAGAVEPMALNEVLTPYSWPTAIHGDGTQAALSLADAPCGIDDVIEWSPHDVLVFVSIPAW